jgi:hypothetical protein
LRNGFVVTRQGHVFEDLGTDKSNYRKNNAHSSPLPYEPELFREHADEPANRPSARAVRGRKVCELDHPKVRDFTPTSGDEESVATTSAR